MPLLKPSSVFSFHTSMWPAGPKWSSLCLQSSSILTFAHQSSSNSGMCLQVVKMAKLFYFLFSKWFSPPFCMTCSCTSLLCSTQKSLPLIPSTVLSPWLVFICTYTFLRLPDLSWFVVPNKIFVTVGVLFLFTAAFLGLRIKPGKTCISWIDELIKFHTRTYLCLLFGYSVFISEGIKATATITWFYDTKFKYYMTWRNFSSFYIYLQAHRKYKHLKMANQVNLCKLI